jgi:hypothetical protein
MVQMVATAVDYGDAAEVYVSRVARVSRISNNIVRVTYCAEREGPHGIERRVVVHLLGDLEELAAEVERMRKGIEIARSEPPLNRDTPHRVEWH